MRLTALGLPDVVIDARFQRNFSRITNPFTGLRRPIGRSAFGGEHWKYQMDVGIRHDVTAWGFSYGATYDDRHGNLIESNIRVFERESQSPRIEAFAEKKLTGSLVLRVECYSLIWHRSQECKRRKVYARRRHPPARCCAHSASPSGWTGCLWSACAERFRKPFFTERASSRQGSSTGRRTAAASRGCPARR